MKKPLLIINCLIILLACLPATALQGQTNETPEIANVKTHIIKSVKNNKEYRLHVLLPKNYPAEDTVKYPVLYVLDGKYSATLFYSVVGTFALANELRDIIIVAIDGNVKTEQDWQTSRYHDYTPSLNPQADTAIAKYFKLPVSTSGGAADFLSTLENEIIPLIEKQYNTGNERGLFGHSLGGLFAGYCLLERPGLFQKYSMNSPSFWWNNGEMIAKADSLAKKNQKISAEIFISAGELEGGFMISPVKGFVQSLSNNFPDTKITNKIFEDETHVSVVPAVCSRSLKMFYSRTLKH